MSGVDFNGDTTRKRELEVKIQEPRLIQSLLVGHLEPVLKFVGFQANPFKLIP